MQIAKIMQQKNIPNLGKFINLLYLCMPIFSLLTTIGTGLTTYATFVQDFMPWLPFWLYIIFVLIIAVLVMIFFWVLVYLGYFINNPIGQMVTRILNLNIKMADKQGVKE